MPPNNLRNIIDLTATIENPGPRFEVSNSSNVTITKQTQPRRDYPNPSDKSTYQTLVTFVVGKDDEKQTFFVHKAYATCYSPVFAAAFDGDFKEGKTQKMVLDDINPKEFGFLVHWLYHQLVEEEDGDWVDEILLHAKVWCLGQRFLIHKLQNDAMTYIVSLFRTAKFKESGDEMARFKKFVEFVYGEELEGSVLRKVVVDKIALDISVAELDNYNWFEDLPFRLWYDVTLSLKGIRDGLTEDLMANRVVFYGHQSVGLHESNYEFDTED